MEGDTVVAVDVAEDEDVGGQGEVHGLRLEQPRGLRAHPAAGVVDRWGEPGATR